MRRYYRPKKSKDVWKQYVLDQLRPLKRQHIGADRAESVLRASEASLQDSERSLMLILAGQERDTSRARYAAGLIIRLLSDVHDEIKRVMPELPSALPLTVPQRFKDRGYVGEVTAALSERLAVYSNGYEALQGKYSRTPKLLRVITLLGSEKKLGKLYSKKFCLQRVLDSRKSLAWAFYFLSKTDWPRAFELEVEIERSKLMIRLCRSALGLTTRSKPSPNTVRARIAAIDKKSRDLAARHRDYIPKLNDCPYCSGPIAPGAHRLDHIYAVKLGGLSIPENLIWVCDPCNSAKSDRGLSDFLLSRGYAIQPVLERLRALGKHV